MRRPDPRFASVRRCVQITTVAALLLVLGARPVTVDAITPSSTPSTVPGSLGGRIVIHTASSWYFPSSTHLTIGLEGNHGYGPYDVPINAEKSIEVAPGTYTARARIGAVSCPNQTLKAEKGKHVDVFYIVARFGNSLSSISCTRPPR